MVSVVIKERDIGADIKKNSLLETIQGQGIFRGIYYGRQHKQKG